MRFLKKKFKGNISLLIILILLASSVVALLSINQIKHLLSYGNMTFNYFRSYYLAKAGTELGLTEVYNREDGFSHKINSGDSIVKNNLIEAYSGFNPYFDVDINSNFEYLTDDIRYECNNKNTITLKTGDGIMLALFKDTADLDNTNKIISGGYISIKSMSTEEIKDLAFDHKLGGGDITFGLFIFDQNNKSMDKLIVQKGKDLNEFIETNGEFIKKNINDEKRAYLTIKNSGDKDISFCIKGKGEIPYHDSLITVRGNYGDVEVGLESVVKKSTPSWSLDIIGDTVK